MMIYLMLFTQILFAQSYSDIRLPQIPIYIDNECQYSTSGLIQLPEGYGVTNSIDNAFIEIKIEDSRKYTGWTLGHIGPVLGYCFGPPLLLATLIHNFGADTTSFGSAYASSLIIWTANQYYLSRILKKLFRKKSNYKTIFITHYTYKLFNNNKLKSYKDKQDFRGDVNSYQFNHSVLSKLLSELNPYWETMNTLKFEYDKKIEYSNINLWKNNNIANSGNSTVQGEFETTLQYEERRKPEKYARRAIESEYRQKIEQRKEKYATKRIKLRRDIEKLADEIRFERSYDFNKSVYNADQQLYTFTIPDLRLTKKLVVPIKEAPGFDSRAGNLIIKQMVKPSLDGRWIPVYDDVVLAPGC